MATAALILGIIAVCGTALNFLLTLGLSGAVAEIKRG